MVEANPLTNAQKFASLNGPMNSVFNFLDPKSIFEMQGMNKRMYEKIVPNFKPAWPMSKSDFVLVKGRKEFYHTTWSKNAAQLKSHKLFQIGGETKVSQTEATLGFKELYFQFTVMQDKWNYLVFELTDEAFIEQGYHLQFDQNMKFKSSTKIAKMPARCMRPTIVPIKRDGEKQYVFVGGFEHRHCLIYTGLLKPNVAEADQPLRNKWHYISKIPEGHNITTTVSCNWKDEAVFTFMTDAQLNFKSAVMDLKQIELKPDEASNTADMVFAYKKLQAEHKIDRFHFKCACAIPSKNQIAVMCRGRTEGMKEQISGLILFFNVTKDNAGAWQLTFDSNNADNVKRCFPTIFTRQLDYMQRAGDQVVCAQDTPDEMNFQLVSVSTTLKRKCGVNLQHKFYQVAKASNEEEAKE